MRLPLLATLAAATLTIPAVGQAKPDLTSITADFGFVSAAGNTSVTTLNFGDKFQTQTADKRVIFSQTFNAVRSEADGVRNAENYRTQLRLDYGVGGRVYLFGLTGWDRNVPAGVARRFEETIGLSVKVVTAPKTELSLELGLSGFQQRNTATSAGADRQDNYTAGRAAAAFKHGFGKASFFLQNLELIPNFDNSTDFRLNSESALVAPISTRVGLKLGYVIRYDNLPGLKPDPNPNGARFRKADRFLTAGISISY